MSGSHNPGNGVNPQEGTESKQGGRNYAHYAYVLDIDEVIGGVYWATKLQAVWSMLCRLASMQGNEKGRAWHKGEGEIRLRFPSGHTSLIGWVSSILRIHRTDVTKCLTFFQDLGLLRMEWESPTWRVFMKQWSRKGRLPEKVREHRRSLDALGDLTALAGWKAWEGYSDRRKDTNGKRKGRKRRKAVEVTPAMRQLEAEALAEETGFSPEFADNIINPRRSDPEPKAVKEDILEALASYPSAVRRAFERSTLEKPNGKLVIRCPTDGIRKIVRESLEQEHIRRDVVDVVKSRYGELVPLEVSEVPF